MSERGSSNPPLSASISESLGLQDLVVPNMVFPADYYRNQLTSPLLSRADLPLKPIPYL